MLVTVTSPVVENPTTKNTKQGIMTESATAETKVDATAVEEEEPTQKEETAANNSDEAMKNIESKEGEETKEGAKKEEAEEEKKKPKIDPKNWPLRDIKETCDNDVLFGRGGGWIELGFDECILCYLSEYYFA